MGNIHLILIVLKGLELPRPCDLVEWIGVLKDTFAGAPGLIPWEGGVKAEEGHVEG